MDQLLPWPFSRRQAYYSLYILSQERKSQGYFFFFFFFFLARGLSSNITTMRPLYLEKFSSCGRPTTNKGGLLWLAFSIATSL